MCAASGEKFRAPAQSQTFLAMTWLQGGSLYLDIVSLTRITGADRYPEELQRPYRIILSLAMGLQCCVDPCIFLAPSECYAGQVFPAATGF